MKYTLTSLLILFLFATLSIAQQVPPYSGKFESIDAWLDAPSPYRTASGAPGAEYWQQRADYKIKASIDEVNNILEGEETITYFNKQLPTARND